MKSRFQNHTVEWVFIAALAMLCSVLAGLQYHWTGEIARAEAERLQANIEKQAQQFCQEFDEELTRACNQLKPTRAELEKFDRPAAHTDRLKQWLATKPRPIFSRVAMATQNGNEIQFLLADLKTGQFIPGPWPKEWSVLQENLQQKTRGGSPPYEDPDGLLLEFPVRGATQISSWLVVELDQSYLRNVWLPDLIHRYLNYAEAPLYEVTVRSDNRQIYASAERAEYSLENPRVTEFNRQGRGANRQGPPYKNMWDLQVRRLPGALDAMVASSRTKNLVVALVLNALILTAGLALLRYTRRTRRLAASQMSFVANVSHELRTPLTVIRGAAHNLERGVVNNPDRVAQYASLISRHAEELQDMVEQVLEFAGAKSNARALAYEPLALQEILKESIAAVSPDAEAAGCKVEAEIADDLPQVKGDASALRRAIQNLIANAAKHAASGSWIGIKATGKNGSGPPVAEITVSDHGPGIPLAEQKEIFEPFVRGSAAQAAQTRGSGIGLSLVREIVEAHAGKVSVHSTPGEGATFAIQLPGL